MGEEGGSAQSLKDALLFQAFVGKQMLNAGLQVYIGLLNFPAKVQGVLFTIGQLHPDKSALKL